MSALFLLLSLFLASPAAAQPDGAATAKMEGSSSGGTAVKIQIGPDWVKGFSSGDRAVDLTIKAPCAISGFANGGRSVDVALKDGKAVGFAHGGRAVSLTVTEGAIKGEASSRAVILYITETGVYGFAGGGRKVDVTIKGEVTACQRLAALLPLLDAPDGQ